MSDPNTGDVRYIGRTKNFRRRSRQHLYDSRSTCKARWVQSLLRLGLRPVIVPLETIISTDDWRAAEIRWIKHFRDLGSILTNATDGGDGTTGFVHAKETREQISKSLSGRPHDESRRKSIGAGQKGKPKSAEWRVKASAGQKRRWSDPEQKERQKSAMEAHYNCAEAHQLASERVIAGIKARREVAIARNVAAGMSPDSPRWELEGITREAYQRRVRRELTQGDKERSVVL